MKPMKLLVIASIILGAIFITIAVLVHNHPTANPAPLYYFAVPLMVAKIYSCYLLINKPYVPNKEEQTRLELKQQQDVEWNKYWMN